MSIFSRLGTLLKSNVNDMISRAEDPKKILTQLIIDMQEQLVEAKKQVAVAIADEKRLKKQLSAEQASAAKWEQKAILAVRAGNDELARQALARKAEHERLAEEYQTQWDAQLKSTDQLRAALHQLNAKIEEAKRKKNILIARTKRAEAQKQIQATMQGFSDTSAFDAFDRMAAKVDQLEAEAEAQADLAGELAGDKLEEQFRELEKGDDGADLALLELKAKMGLLDSPKPVGSLPEHATGTKTDNNQP